MIMIKKTMAIILATSFICLCFSMPALAQMDASDYIAATSAELNQGNVSGQLRVSYSITATSSMDTIGVSRIEVYYSNGTKYTTIWGTISSGLLKQNRPTASDTYALSLTSGTSYYCKVTLYAAKDGGWDSRTITTGTVTAP